MKAGGVILIFQTLLIFLLMTNISDVNSFNHKKTYVNVYVLQDIKNSGYGGGGGYGGGHHGSKGDDYSYIPAMLGHDQHHGKGKKKGKFINVYVIQKSQNHGGGGGGYGHGHHGGGYGGHKGHYDDDYKKK